MHWATLFALAVAALFLFPTNATADVILVPSESAPTIQAGIDIANPGDVVQVAPGTYSENVVISKEITVESTAGAASTTIDGSSRGECVSFAGSLGNSCVLRNFTITAGSSGADCNTSRPTIEGCTFLNFSGFHIDDAHPTEAGAYAAANTFIGNYDGRHNGIRLGRGIIDQSTTWPAMSPGMVYYLSNSTYSHGTDYTVSVRGASSPVLTIEPGAIIKSPPTSHPYGHDREQFFLVGHGEPGSIVATGVYFTSTADDALGGDSNGDGLSVGAPKQWSCIYFGSNATGSVLDGCIIRYGGATSYVSTDAAIYIANSDPTVQDCQFVNNYTSIRVAGGSPSIINNTIDAFSGYGVWLDIPSVFHSVSGNTIINGGNWQARVDPMAVESFVLNNTLGLNTNGKHNGIYVEEGVVSQSTRWPALPVGMVYYLSGTTYSHGRDFCVKVEGASSPLLTIDPGVIVKMPSTSHPYGHDREQFLMVGVNGPGRLSAQGVYFTSVTDDELGGDSNGDGVSFGSAGYWSSIFFGSLSGGSTLDGCFVRYGGNSSYNEADAAVYILQGIPTITNCQFDDNRIGLRVNNSNPVISDNTIDGSTHYGLWLDIGTINHYVSGNTVTNGAHWQAVLDPMAVEMFVSRNTIELNSNGKHNGVYVLEGEITQSTSWPLLPPGMVYYLLGGTYSHGLDYTVKIEGAGNPELTIETGNVVKLPAPSHPYGHDREQFLQVGVVLPGRLNAQGVYFTASTDDELGGDSNGDGLSFGSPGYWSAIYLGGESGGSVIRDCTIRFGGNSSYNAADAAVYVLSSSPTIDACNFSDNRTSIRVVGGNPTISENLVDGCTSYGMWLDIPVVSHSVSGNTIQNCDNFPALVDPMAVENLILNNTIHANPSGSFNAIRIHEGVVAQSTTWPALPSGFVYWLSGSSYSHSADYCVKISGAGNPQLTIATGVAVKMPRASHPYGHDREQYFLVGHGEPGVLVAEGVTFTAAVDDSEGGDSNGDGNASSPYPGYWSAIYFSNLSAGSRLENCKIKYGGMTQYNSADAAVYIHANDATIDDCIFDDNMVAVRTNESSPSITNSDFASNTVGIRSSNSTPQIHDNFFQENSSYAVQNQSTHLTIDATNNYWGDDNGPYDPTDAISGPPDYNDNSAGEPVSDYVQYRPWSDCPERPNLIVNHFPIVFEATQYGDVPDPGVLTIFNAGEGMLEWSVTSTQPWVYAQPSSGTGNDEYIDVIVNTTDLPLGTYYADLVVTSNAANGDQTVQVRYNVVAEALSLLSPGYPQAIEVGSELDIVWTLDPLSDIEDVQLFYQTPAMASKSPILGLGDLPADQWIYTWTLPDYPLEDITISITGHNAAGSQIAEATAEYSVHSYIKGLVLSADNHRVFGWQEVEGATSYQLVYDVHETWSTFTPSTFSGPGTTSSNFIRLPQASVDAMSSTRWTVNVKAYNGASLINSQSHALLVAHLEKVQPYSDDPSGQPVLLVHGAMSDATAWHFNDMVDDLMSRGYRFWTFQYPNVGDLRESGWAFGHALRAMTRETGPLYNRVPVIAHSMGGVMTRTYLEGLGRDPWGGVAPVDDLVSHLITSGSPHQGAWLLKGQYLNFAAEWFFGELLPVLMGAPQPDDYLNLAASPAIQIYLVPEQPFLDPFLNNDEDHHLNADIRHLFSRGCIRLTSRPDQSSLGPWAAYTAMTIATGKSHDGLIMREDAIPPEEMWDNGAYVRTRSKTLNHSQLVRAGTSVDDHNVDLFDNFMSNVDVAEDAPCYCCIEILAKYTTKVYKWFGGGKGDKDPSGEYRPAAGIFGMLQSQSDWESGLGSNYVFQTDSSGTIVVPYLPAGDYALTLYSGEDTTTVFVTLDSANQEITQFIYLSDGQSSGFDLESPWVSIEGGAQFASDSVLDVSVGCIGATEVRVSNSSNLEGAAWQDVATPLSVVTSGAPGPKSVWAEFRDASDNRIGPVIDLIVLDTVLTSQLTVTSNIPGASIVLNGLGTHETTPHTFDSIPSGSHSVSVGLSGHSVDQLSQTVDLSAGSSASVEFVLSPSLPPTRPDCIAPTENATTCGDSLQLTWGEATDPEGGIVYYNVTIVDDTLSPAFHRVVTCVEDTSSTIENDFAHGQAMFWSVIAVDQLGTESEASEWTSFCSQGVTCYECGDVQGEGGGVDISDIVYFAAWLFQGGSAPPVPSAADVNGSGGDPDISDIVYLASYMFLGGPAPACGCD